MSTQFNSFSELQKLCVKKAVYIKLSNGRFMRTQIGRIKEVAQAYKQIEMRFAGTIINLSDTRIWVAIN